MAGVQSTATTCTRDRIREPRDRLVLSVLLCSPHSALLRGTFDTIVMIKAASVR